ncbi:hypothetical protein K3H35_01295 [Aeromonas veronii]|uniref:Uncharacterized protein n=1 Tax=Aeromonas veronii TaxID=654 RepID=A0AAC9FLH1_AERVE|nr:MULTISPECIES: hypothetical protein [Aeromonas]ANB52841.1 hypothetical protein WM43_09265 [Aeromonas veronii]MCF5907456.1 hypothetical protein [Aeromonas veronii]MCR3966153.1 hypothetical protein [Aeromonas veronii]MCR3978629.1 hypothetical protein [Aeromonas veronii]UUI61867.1 hypothetical protein NP805_04525 [Aeromonas salmonicida]
MGSIKEAHEFLALNGPLGLNVRDDLQRFVDKVRAGEKIGHELLEFIADGVERHLKNGNATPWPVNGGVEGRPESTSGPSDEHWRQIAEVQFYRRLLPEYDGRAPSKQSALAKQFGYKDTKSIRNMEKAVPPFLLYVTPRGEPPPFYTRLRELIDAEGLVGVTYDRFADQLGKRWAITRDGIRAIKETG